MSTNPGVRLGVLREGGPQFKIDLVMKKVFLDMVVFFLKKLKDLA